MGTKHNQSRNPSRKEYPIQNFNEGREKERLGMEKGRILAKTNPNSSTMDVNFFYPLSPQEKHGIKGSVQSNSHL